MISKTALLTLFLVPAAPLFLGACAMKPSPMPAGYAYHDQLYKSPPAARPRAVGYDYSEQLSNESAAHWRVAARDMVARIAAKNGIPTTPVYVEPSLHKTPFAMTFDNFLRESLIDAGFMLASAPGHYPVIRYRAAIVEHEAYRSAQDGKNDEPYEGRQRYAALEEPGPIRPVPPRLPGTDTEVILSVSVVSGEFVVAEETGVYYIPEADEYQYRGKLFTILPVVGEF